MLRWYGAVALRISFWAGVESPVIKKSLREVIDTLGFDSHVSSDADGKSSIPKDGLDPDRLARLIRTIEGEIVPRLVVSRRLKVPAGSTEYKSSAVLDELDVKEFVRLLLSHESGVASAYVEAVRQRGATLEAVCLELLAPSARELGLLWEEDECDFMQVTIGLCRLHQVLRELSPAFDADPDEWHEGRAILLVPYPGEQHTFGVTLVAQFLRRAGWTVCQECPKRVDDLIGLTRLNHFALVGLSVGCEVPSAEVAEAIRSLRLTSRNPQIGVLVGGPMFVAQPTLAGRGRCRRDGNGWT